MKLLPLAALLAAASLAHAQAPASFVLKGTLPKVKGPAQVFLRREGILEGAITDSAAVINGAFELRGTMAAPTKAKLVLVPQGKKRRMRTGQADNASFYLEKGPIVFTSPDSLVNATVKGAALNEQYQQLEGQLKPVNQKLNVLYTEYRAATPEQRQAPAFQQDQDRRETALEAEYKTVSTAFIKAHPQTLVSLDAIKQMAGPCRTMPPLRRFLIRWPLR